MEEYWLFPMLLNPVGCMHVLLLELRPSQWWNWNVWCSGAIRTRRTDLASQAAAAGILLCSVTAHTWLSCMVKGRSQHNALYPFPISTWYIVVLSIMSTDAPLPRTCFIICTWCRTDVSVTLHWKKIRDSASFPIIRTIVKVFYYAWCICTLYAIRAIIYMFYYEEMLHLYLSRSSIFGHQKVS